MTITELMIIAAFVQRVNDRADKQMHKPEGSHYAAMMFELEKLRSESTRCRCDLQGSPDAPAHWHRKRCPVYQEPQR